MINKKLKLSIIAISAVGLIGLTGCGADNRSYHFDDKLDGEQVKFYETGPRGEYNFLEVTKPDGRTILYKDVDDNDLKIDYVNIRIGNKTETYSRSIEVDRPVIEKAQRQFDDYLQKIWDYKQKKGLSSIKE